MKQAGSVHTQVVDIQFGGVVIPMAWNNRTLTPLRNSGAQGNTSQQIPRFRSGMIRSFLFPCWSKQDMAIDGQH